MSSGRGSGKAKTKKNAAKNITNDTENIKILKIILEVFASIVDGMQPEKDDEFIEYIKKFCYIIHLYNDDIYEFKEKFKNIYKKITKLRNEQSASSNSGSSTYSKKTKKKKNELDGLIEGKLQYNKLSQHSSFKLFNLVEFFQKHFQKVSQNDRIQKRGFLYLIKLTPYIILLTILDDYYDINEKNIEDLKEVIKFFAINIKPNIDTFLIDKYDTEYIELNKLIYDLERKVVDKIETFQKGSSLSSSPSRPELFKEYNVTIENVISKETNTTDKYSDYMITAYDILIEYLNVNYFPVIEVVRDMSIATTPAAKEVKLAVRATPDPAKLAATAAEEAEATETAPPPASAAADKAAAVAAKSAPPAAADKPAAEQAAAASPAPPPASAAETATSAANTAAEEAATATAPAPAPAPAEEAAPAPLPASAAQQAPPVEEAATQQQQQHSSSTAAAATAAASAWASSEEAATATAPAPAPAPATAPATAPADADAIPAQVIKDGLEVLTALTGLINTSAPAPEEGKIKPETKSKTLPYNEEELKQKYLYTQKYKDGIDDAKLNELLELKSENSDNLYNDQSSNNKIVQLASYIDIFNNKRISDDAATPEDYKDIIAKIRGFENDPKNPVEALEIKFEDRLVFIIATFFIRYVAISMIQRGIDINLITTFYDGFIYYGCIYLVLFWFVVLFINIDDKYTTKYIDTSGFINYIRSLFYYFYMGTNGISRLLIHSLLLIVIIIIPIILNIKNKNNININEDTKDTGDTAPIVMLTLEERTKLSKLLSVFTLFIWILTSIIATKF